MRNEEQQLMRLSLVELMQTLRSMAPCLREHATLSLLRQGE